MVSPLASLGDSVHPRLTLGAPGRELDQQLSLGSTGGEKKTPVEALLLDLPVLSLPSHHVTSLWHVTEATEMDHVFFSETKNLFSEAKSLQT